MTEEIRLLIQEKNRLYAKFCRKPLTYGQPYRVLRNRVNNMVDCRKKLYYQSLLGDCASDCKKTWNILNGLMGRKTRDRNCVQEIIKNETITS